jgi:hypothetical protein
MSLAMAGCPTMLSQSEEDAALAEEYGRAHRDASPAGQPRPNGNTPAEPPRAAAGAEASTLRPINGAGVEAGRFDGPIGLDDRAIFTLSPSYAQWHWGETGVGTLAGMLGEMPLLESDDTLTGFGLDAEFRWRCPCMEDTFDTDVGYGFVGLGGAWLSGEADVVKPAGIGYDFAVTYLQDSPGGFTGANFGDTAAEAEIDVDVDWFDLRLGAGYQVQYREDTTVDYRFGLSGRYAQSDYDGWAGSLAFPGNFVAYDYDIDAFQVGVFVGAELNHRLGDSNWHLFAGAEAGFYYTDADLDAGMDANLPANGVVADQFFSQSADDDDDTWGLQGRVELGLEYRISQAAFRVFAAYEMQTDVATADSKDSPIDGGPGIDFDDSHGVVFGVTMTLWY